MVSTCALHADHELELLDVRVSAPSPPSSSPFLSFSLSTAPRPPRFHHRSRRRGSAIAAQLLLRHRFPLSLLFLSLAASLLSRLSDLLIPPPYRRRLRFRFHLRRCSLPPPHLSLFSPSLSLFSLFTVRRCPLSLIDYSTTAAAASTTTHRHHRAQHRRRRHHQIPPSFRSAAAATVHAQAAASAFSAPRTAGRRRSLDPSHAADADSRQIFKGMKAVTVGALVVDCRRRSAKLAVGIRQIHRDKFFSFFLVIKAVGFYLISIY
ncbi:uncharacterized protein LOC121781587 [Salvia splendens]|uniref:uncharacterized protein LOC121781587 n=1 Tax=Salvia splendens TaxID=180675 RepID=UPI001C26B100|nr:uncharacterized protein LOC121781587 [Salvia splendens]